MKKIFCIVLLFCLLSPTVLALDANVGVEMPQEWAEIVDEAPVSAEEFKQMTLQDYIQKGIAMFTDSMLAPLRLLAKLCGIILLAATAKSFVSSSTGSETASLLDTVITLSIFTLCCAPMLNLMGVMQTAILQCRDYLACFVPVFASVLISCGQISSSVVYSGFFFGFSSLMANLLCSVALPLTRVFLALGAAGSVSTVMDLSRITTGISKWMKWLLAFLATVFATVLGLQGVLAQSADTFALKTGKFLVGNSVPVVGRAVSDAMGTVFAGLRMIKGTVGFAVVAVIATLFIPILIQCVVHHLVFSVSAMVASATDNPKAAQLFDGFAQCISLYISLIFFFLLVVVSATILMVLLGSGG